jgi:hypothetical protein
MKKLQRGLPKGRYSKYGYKRNSPDVNKPFNIIPSGNITMKDVDFPVRGVDNLGNEIVMMPGREYTFPGDYVVETPYQKGGESNATYNSNWLNKYQDAGEVPPKDNYIEVRSGNTFDDYITNPLINGIARGLDVTGDWLNNTLQSATKNALETMYNSPTTASTAARIQYGARPWLGKNIRPVAYPGIFTAPIELTRGALGMNPPPSKDAQGDYSVEEEAWRKALGLQMNPKYIVPSNYKPSKAKNPNAQYYTLNRDVIDPQLLIAEAKRRNLQEGQSVVISSLAPYIRENFMPKDEFSQIDPLQNFTIGVGKDKKGKYVSIYDKYDFEGPLNSFITPYEFYDRYYYQRAGQTSPTYFGGTLPTADIVSDNSGTQYPYYKNLTDEEKRFFSSNTPIGRAVRAKAQTGKVGQTYNDLSKAAKTIGKTAAEFTGVPGAVRFSRNPSENLKGALSTIEKTIIGASPGVPQSSTPYDSKEVEGFFNTLDAAGLASMGAPLVKTGISGARALPVVARQAGRYATTQTPLRNAYKYNPWAFKPDPKAAYRMLGDEGFDDAIQVGYLRAKPSAGKWNTQTGKVEYGTPNYEHPYFSVGKPWDKNLVPGKPHMGYKGPYMAELKNQKLIENDLGYSTGRNNIFRPEEQIFTDNPNLRFYKEDWLRGYKPIEVPRQLPGFPNAPVGNIKKEMYRWLDEQMRFDKLPQTTNKQSIEVLDNFKQRIKTPEGQKRLKKLGITKDKLLQDLKIVEDPNTYGYYAGRKNTIVMNPDHPLPKKVVRHEIEHGVQNAMQKQAIKDEGKLIPTIKRLFTDPLFKKPLSEKITKANTEIDDILSGLTLRREGTLNKVWDNVDSQEAVNINEYKSLISDKQNATDYFLTGSSGREKSAFLAEVQQYMMDQGTIPNKSYVKITPEMVKDTFVNAMFDESGGGKYLRIFNIMKPTENNYKLISEAMNKMLGIAPYVGIGTAGALGANQLMNQQPKSYKRGGSLPKAQFGAFGTIPTSPPFMPQKENVVTSKKVDNLPKIKVNTTVPDEMITIKDGRKIRLTTGQAINPNTDLVGKSYSTKALRSILNTAKNRGLSKNDALTLAAMDLQETRWGETDDHMGHVLYGNNSTISPAENFINAYLRSKETANRLKLSDEYTRLQVYNGLGKVTPNTEKDYHGFRMKKIYGVPVPKSGIDMKKNPLYGKQIVDIRDNVLKQNSEFLKLVDEYYKMGGITNEMLDVYKNYINGVYTNTEKEKDAIKVYDKLNRKYYREAKNANKSVPNYIMSLIK